jgi:hypothetical protein
VANFLALSAQLDHRINELTAQLYRVEVSLRRGERRAAKAQLRGLQDELAGFGDELRAPAEFILIGANVGLFSGGAWRGRVSGALFGAAAGWLYGQSAMSRHRRHAAELLEYAAELQAKLDAPADGAADQAQHAPAEQRADA